MCAGFGRKAQRDAGDNQFIVQLVAGFTSAFDGFNQGSGFAVTGLRQQHHKLIAAGADQHILVPDAAGHNPGDADQQLIPFTVAKGIVDQFEAVDIADNQR